MQTIRLRIHDSVYDKLIWLLGKFTKDEIEIIQEGDTDVRAYLSAELDEIKGGKAKFVNLDDAENRLENMIKSHENKILAAWRGK